MGACRIGVAARVWELHGNYRLPTIVDVGVSSYETEPLHAA